MAILDSLDAAKGWRKWLVSTWSIFECLLLTGIFYGWSSLVFVFRDEGIYGELCEGGSYNESLFENKDLNSSFASKDEGQRDCGLQDDRFALCFTIASFGFGGLSSVMGYVNYRTGTRISRLISYLMNTAGVLCLAFVSQDFPWLMYPGMFLIAVAGLSLFVTNTQVANVFTKFSSTFIGLQCGAFDSSSAIFLFIKIAHQHGFPRRNAFFLLAALFGLTHISNFLFLPKGFVSRRELYRKDDDALEKESKASELEQDKWYNVLKQPLYITFILWLSLLQLRFFIIIGTLNTFLNVILDEDKNKVSYYTDVCYYTMMSSLITSMAVCALYGQLKRICKRRPRSRLYRSVARAIVPIACQPAFSGDVGVDTRPIRTTAVFFQRGRSRLYQSVAPAIIPMALASLLSVVMSVLILVPSEPLFYLMFVVLTLKRCLLYSMFTAFTSAVFPSQFFGILFGVAMTTASAISCFQYAFFHWAESYGNGRFHADICLLFVSLLTLCHPIYMWICAIRAENAERITSELKEQQGHGNNDYYHDNCEENID